MIEAQFVARQFPLKCRTCSKREVSPVTVDYSVEMEHDGRAYSLRIPDFVLLECASCHTRLLTDEGHKLITEALREQAGLMTPEEIKDQRRRMDLTQEDLARHLKVAKETVSRWETGGQIQQRAMDVLLRVFFGLNNVLYWQMLVEFGRQAHFQETSYNVTNLTFYLGEESHRIYHRTPSLRCTAQGHVIDPIVERMKAVQFTPR